MEEFKKFVDNDYLVSFFENKKVVVVGSGPSCLENEREFIDSHDIVVRVNNYKLTKNTGFKTHVHYSYFGGAIRKENAQLKKDGVILCINKCPCAKFMESDWHKKNRKNNGVDFRYIYEKRKDWWFCPTFVPEVGEFMETFELLQKHVPTTGFSAIHKLVNLPIKSLHVTGFDFFESGIHNVDERWVKMNKTDPICHRPDLEKLWLKNNYEKYPIILDKTLKVALNA